MTKCGERKPRSNCIPSTTSTVVSAPRPSSTVITPSLPTLIKASARTAPIVGSLLPAIVATCWISFLLLPSIAVERFVTSPQIASTAFEIPRDRAIGSNPEAIILSPSRKIASARTVAVVVPSPATSFVLLAASLTSWTPRFSYGSSSSISSATVTPSLVIFGLPQPLSRIALRPRGPRVLRTARANLETPSKSGLRAASSKTICFATGFLRYNFEFVIYVLGKCARCALFVERSLVFDEVSFVSLLTYSQPANSSPAPRDVPYIASCVPNFWDSGI